MGVLSDIIRTKNNSGQYKNSIKNNVQHFVPEAYEQAQNIYCAFAVISVSAERKNNHV